ncbi:uncharacterized protein MELLADRAFT_124260 [Melampsora larici-populina 98AG31]|uniref:Secreted protein n=1 Tax=Melampsora larici-populina (strain 98AG31 / pathotype 3-4-7) TaxID=747676 RepID=F4RVT9_MELLP|nr:uncharacterized protein MELLADRAFT_124260 [Melampsora larici-populina 98AG31]EGG03524.1 secreted protein [Melampsora larici-populina 98AG31]
MIGIQLKEIVLLSLILNILIIPMMCEMVEHSEDITGFSRSRKSRTSLEVEDGDDRQRHEYATCSSVSCNLSSTCTNHSLKCSDCGLDGYCKS